MHAPAKLNLHLTVGPLGLDGYHPLSTVFHAVSVRDELAASPGPLSLTVTGEGADELPTDRTNLAVRAVELIAAETGHPPDVRLELHKAIPVAGGCAGGSADAAAALVACDALWGCELPRDRLAALGARLGSDVPFCLHGGTALGTGRGEQLTPVLGRGSYSWVLAVADGGLSTPAVYAELDRQRARGPVRVAGDPSEVLAALRAGDARLLGQELSNDLQPAALALRPALQGVLDAGVGLGALGAVVSGSGPTVALLARDGAHADEIAAGLGGLARQALVASGPVAGARVVG